MDHIQIDPRIATLLHESEAVFFLKGMQVLIVKNDPNQTESEVKEKLRKCLDNDEQDDH